MGIRICDAGAVSKAAGHGKELVWEQVTQNSRYVGHDGYWLVRKLQVKQPMNNVVNSGVVM